MLERVLRLLRRLGAEVTVTRTERSGDALTAFRFGSRDHTSPISNAGDEAMLACAFATPTKLSRGGH